VLHAAAAATADKDEMMSSAAEDPEQRKKRRRTYAGSKVRRFAWLPRRVSSGSWIWLKSYYVWSPYTIDPELIRSRRRWF
jgi:hypothetical protein